MKEEIPLDKLIDLIIIDYDKERIETGIKRQIMVQENKEPDYLPLFLHGKIPEMDRFPSYDRRDQFYDPEKMLYTLLWGCLSIIRGKADNIPCVRVNFGTGFLATVFGLEQQIFPDKMPWLKSHLEIEKIMRMQIEDLEPLENKGLIPQWKQYTDFYREKLKDIPFIKMYLPDTQGVFDLAHLVAGDIIFTEFYDNQDFINHLLFLTSHVYRFSSILMKYYLNEPVDSGYHGEIIMAHAGVRTCEDTTTLLSPQIFEKIYPYFQKSISDFGAFVHFCGNGRHLLQYFLNCPYVKIINFGNPEMFDWDKTINEITNYGKTYYGTVKRKQGEEMKEYFERVLNPLKRKGNLMFAPVLFDNEDTQKALEIWHKIQDKKFS